MSISPAPPIAAIFDMDHPLLTGSSGSTLVTYLRRSRRLHPYLRRQHLHPFLLSVLGGRRGIHDAARLFLNRRTRACLRRYSPGVPIPDAAARKTPAHAGGQISRPA